MPHSIVEYHSDQQGYSCGYCRRPDSNYSHGMWAHMMSVADYQRLIDRGWRRSGKYCYKPTMDLLCCPMYTIRCRVLEFKPTKSQKKILKKVNKYLSDDKESTTPERPMSAANEEDMSNEIGDQFVEPSRQSSNVNVDSIIVDNLTEVQVKADTDNKIKTDTPPENAVVVEKTIKQGVGMDSAKGPCKKAKQIRLERKLEKMRQKGLEVTSLKQNKMSVEKQVEDFLQELPEEIRNKLEVRLVRTAPPSEEWERTSKEAHRVYTLYQTTVHGDTVAKCSEKKFKDFLVESPLKEEYSQDGPPRGYGSFHQQYWIEGRMIATGVIDILPSCVSSVYFFYDPQFMNLTFGTYGALREIAFTRHLHSMCPNLKYYYMGFYIHSCRKMRYKGNFHPSDLLCPETYKWFPMEDCVPKLDSAPYSRLNPDIDAVDEDHCSESDLNSIPLLVDSTVMRFDQYSRSNKVRRNEIDNLLEYGRLVGKTSVSELILVR